MRHAALLFPMLREPSLYIYMNGDPPASIAELQAKYRIWMERCSPDGSELWLNWVARLRDGPFVAWFQATVRSTQAEIAYLVGTEHQRRGYAVEGARAVIDHLAHDFGVVAVEAQADSRNRASIAVATALGMKSVACATPGDVRFAIER
jgi:[ribosomal protein S5]-alanine N-acetyltransferase